MHEAVGGRLISRAGSAAISGRCADGDSCLAKYHRPVLFRKRCFRERALEFLLAQELTHLVVWRIVSRVRKIWTAAPDMITAVSIYFCSS